MTNYLLKRDRAKLDDLKIRVVKRKGWGCLVFLTCSDARLEQPIYEALCELLQDEFEFVDAAYGRGMLNRLKEYDSEAPVLNVFRGYDWDTVNDGGRNARKIASRLNLERDLITSRNLHCVFIMPEVVERALMFDAADFYHFRTWSVHFSDELLPPKESPVIADLKLLEEIGYLERNLNKTRDYIAKANVHMDLAQARLKADDRKKADEHLRVAEKLYKKKRFNEGLLIVAINIANGLVTDGLYEQALEAIKRGGDFLTGDYGNPHRPYVLLLFAAAHERLGNYQQMGTYLERITLSDIETEDRTRFLYNRALHFIGIGKTLEGLKLFKPHLNQADNEQRKNYGQGLLLIGDRDKARTCLKQMKMGVDRRELLVDILVLSAELEEAKSLLQGSLLKPGDWGHRDEMNRRLTRLYLIKQENNKALFAVDKALEALEPTEALVDIKESQILRGEVLIALERYDEAEEVLVHWRDNWGEGPVHGEAQLNRYLGMLYARTERLELAREHAHKALEICERCFYKPEEAYTCRLLGEITYIAGQYQESMEYLEAAFDLVRDFDLPTEARILYDLGQVAEKAPDLDANRWQRRATKRLEELSLEKPLRLFS